MNSQANGVAALCRPRGMTLALALLLISPTAARADDPCPANRLPAVRSGAEWEPPLDRRVSLRAESETLRSVLDRVAAASGVRVTYSPESVPVERRVCEVLVGLPLGDVLYHLLRGLDIEIVPIGATHVVLAPGGATGPGLPESPVFELARLVVTAPAADALHTRSPHATTIIEGDELRRLGSGPLSQALNWFVPGFWAWGAPSAGGTRIAGMRGVSSFGSGLPKVYLDGIEVSNPLVLNQLSPEAIERIEVVRGPQGSALYGTNAINGVISIVSRRTADASEPRAQLRSSVGTGPGDDDRLVHDHTVTVRTGDGLRGAQLTFSGGTEAAVMAPLATYGSALGTGRVTLGSTVITATTRLHLQDSSGELEDGSTLTSRDGGTTMASISQHPWPIRATGAQYTIGTTVEHYRGSRWTHAFVAGIDGYRLRPDAHPEFVRRRLDGILRPNDRDMDRITLRTSTHFRDYLGEEIAAGLTFSAEQLMWREHAHLNVSRDEASAPLMERTDAWQRSTGVSGQANLSLLDRFTFFAGLRVEHAAATGEVTPLPQLGASATVRRADWALMLRGAYGRAMRAPALGAFERSPLPTAVTAGGDPEMQEGIEAGLVVTAGRRFMLELTRFDQKAWNLTQWIGLAAAAQTVAAGNGTAGSDVVPGMQNIGEITNRGWEVQLRYVAEPFSVVATATQLDSRTTQLPGSYSGDLRAGDRMPGLPARTASLLGNWQRSMLQFSLGLSRAWDWIDYDRARLHDDLGSAVGTGRRFTAADLREYWTAYDGGLGVVAGITVWPTQRLGFTVRGDNLLNTWIGGTSETPAWHRRSAAVELRLGF